MLRELVSTVCVKIVVGPNLEVEREQGAFNKLFREGLLPGLADAELPNGVARPEWAPCWKQWETMIMNMHFANG